MNYCEFTHIGKLYALGTPSILGAILQRITNITEARILNISKLFYPALKPQYINVHGKYFLIKQ